MPQVFKIGPWLVYFWLNESEPLPTLRNIIDLIALRSDYIVERWTQKFGECRFYC